MKENERWLERVRRREDINSLKEDYPEIDIKIIVDWDAIENIENTRRPYFRMRGKPVTQEQAFEIIRRTEGILGDIDRIRHSGEYFRCCNFHNSLIDPPQSLATGGWAHPDGMIGYNYFTDKYPDMKCLLEEWCGYLTAFPYLDFVIALTHWNEIPPEIWEMSLDGATEEENDTWPSGFFEIEEYDQKFLDAVEMGLYVHDKQIEVLSREDIIAKYTEYENLYGQSRERYISPCDKINSVPEIDVPYLKRCIEAYGLNVEEEWSMASVRYAGRWPEL